MFFGFKKVHSVLSKRYALSSLRQWSSLGYRPAQISVKITLSSILCIFFPLLFKVMMNCSFFFFVVTHRYYAIVHPLRKRMTKQRAFVHIFIIWFGATLFAVPTLIFSRTLVVRLPHESVKDRTIERTICILKWPDGYPWQSRLDFTYVHSLPVQQLPGGLTNDDNSS